MRRRLHFAPLVLTLTAFSVSGSGCSSCKKKPDADEVKKDKSKKTVDAIDVPPPPDLVFELIVRDPDGIAKRAADAAGFGKEVGASPWETLVGTIHDKEGEKLMRAVAPHGSLAMLVTGKPEDLLDEHKWRKENIGLVGVAHVKDGELARAGLDALVGTKKVKSHPAKVFGGTIYDVDDDTAIAVVDDMVIAADGASHLEASGPYAMALARKGERLEHDATAHLTTASFAPRAEEAALAAWSKLMKDDPPPGVTAAPADALVRSLIAAISDIGDGNLTLDVKGDEVVLDGRLATKGDLSKFLAAWPSGDGAPLLSMPTGASGVSLYRFPDGLGPLAYAIVDENVPKGSKLSAADAADLGKYVRVLGKALGHEVAMTGNASALGLGMGSASLEYFFRVELADPTATKEAAKRLREIFTAAMTGPYDPKVTAAPYTKFGAEGELLTLVDRPWTPPPGSSYKPPKTPDSTFLWAVRGSYLYLDVCVMCTGTFDVAALDAGTKGKLGDDPKNVEKIAKLPSKNVAWAFDADMKTTFSAIFSALGAPLGPMPPVSGYLLASERGLEGHTSLPAQLFGASVRMYLRAAAPAVAYPSPLGTAVPAPLGTTMPPPGE